MSEPFVLPRSVDEGSANSQKAPAAITDGNGATEKSALKTVLKLWEQGRSYRRTYDDKWSLYLDFYNGHQWPEQASKLKARPSVNITRSTIQTILPIMTDTSPGFNVLAQEPTDYAFSEIMEKLVSSWWQKNGLDLTITIPILNSLIYDVGYLKVVWDSSAGHNKGDVSVVPVSPEDIWVPASARSFHSHCPWVIQRLYLSKSELKDLFPSKDKLIDSLSNGRSKDDTYTNTVPDTRDVDKYKPEISGEPGSAIIAGRVGDIILDSEGIEILECWIKEKGEMRVITLAHKDKIVLQDKLSPYSDQSFPFVRFIDTVRPDSFYGEGEVGPLVETQKILNKNFSVILNHQNLMSNPTWIIDSNSGVKPSMLTNEIGLIISKKPGSEVRRESPPQLPAQITENYRVVRQLMDTISGVHDVTQGRKPSGVTAASAIESLQDAAQTRIRLKDRNLQVSLYDLGSLVLSRMLQYYTKPRVIRAVGEIGKKYPDYYEIYIGTDKSGARTYAKRVHKWDEKAKMYAVDDWAKDPISGDLDLTIKTGTSLPLEKNNQKSMALQLYKMKVIDDKELLNRLEYSNAEAILQRKAEQGAEEPPM